MGGPGGTLQQLDSLLLKQLTGCNIPNRRRRFAGVRRNRRPLGGADGGHGKGRTERWRSQAAAAAGMTEFGKVAVLH
jgi:hypothetical protein